ncbi:MAG: ATP-binding protein [Acidimicrobiia bacterium]|nr:ATP-binding protein [Acidimicrobiia bacterium]
MSTGTELILFLLAVAVAALVGFSIGRRASIPSGYRSARLEAPGVGSEEQADRSAQPSADEPPDSNRDRRRDHIEQALDDLRLGVVVFTGGGDELYRNHVGRQFATARHGEALVEAALERVVAAALIGLSPEEEVRLYGPPARTVLVQASPIQVDGGISTVVATIEDVTEARHLDRVRSDFVANVSHELRTPVGAMSVLAETLADTDDPEVRARLAGRIQTEAGRLADTIEDLLILSRLESGPEEAGETFDLVSVVTTAMDRTAESSAQRAVPIEMERRFGGPILVDGSFGQLVSAVANLIENGTKYSSAGSAVTVAVDVESGDGGPQGVLSVIDDGIGIPEADLMRIFERFYRVDTARSRATGGTGLGLSIVRNAVRNHGGSVEVESTEGRGSTFTLRIPLSSAQLQVEPMDVDDLLANVNSDQERD